MLAAFEISNKTLEFLIDTGSSISIIPHHLLQTLNCNLAPTTVTLKSADNKPIKVHGECSLQLSNSCLRRIYNYVFIVAEVSKPILGADFLSKYKLDVSCSDQIIIDRETKLCAPCSNLKIQNFYSIQNSYPENIPSFVVKLLQDNRELLTPIQMDYSIDIPNSEIQHTIDTGTSRPVFARARQLPPHKYDIAKKEFEYMLAAGIIEPSNSEWASPLHMVPKTDGKTFRPCGDYRRLNSITKKDRYPLPHINSCMDKLHGKSIFSKLDIVKAYYQIPVAKQDQKKTAIITPFGLFHFLRMPFGLCNAAQTFQRFIDSIFRDLPFVFTYIDDILVASRSEEEHKNHVKAVIERLAKHKMHIALEKCEFAVHELDFLGFKLSAEGISPRTQKVEVIKEFPLPVDYASLRRFLGMIGFYRRFVPMFADIAEPLYQLLAKCRNKNIKLQWTDLEIESFQKLKDTLYQSTKLQHLNPGEGTFHLVTDASQFAIGAALNQCVNNELFPLAFFSKRLSKTQRTYSAFDRELLAVYLAVAHFKHVIEGRTVTIFTDHKPLVSAFYSQTQPRSDRQQRQLAFISEYACSFEHIRGSENVVADALSRAETPEEIASINIQLPAIATIAEMQKNDPELQEYKNRLKPELTASKEEIWCDNTLSYPRPFVTAENRREIFEGLHNLSHPGVRGTLRLIGDRYYWPKMKKQIKEWVKECEPCQRSKINRHEKTEIKQPQFPSSDRFHTVHLDIVGPLEPSRTAGSQFKSDLRYLLTFIDRATRWFEVVPIDNITAETVADVFLNQWIARFGVPLHIVTDQGRQFESDLFKHLSSVIGFHRIRTTSYHPQSNGMIERFHRTLKTALKTHGKDWLISLPTVTLALRCIPNEHNISPFTAVTGTSPLIPYTYFSRDTYSDKDLPNIVNRLSKCMSEIDFSTLSRGLHNTPQRLTRNTNLSKSDMVFVRIDRVRKPLESPYEGPYEVIDFTDKTVKIKLNDSKTIVVSKDRIKLAHIKKPTLTKKQEPPVTLPSSDIKCKNDKKTHKHVTFKN